MSKITPTFAPGELIPTFPDQSMVARVARAIDDARCDSFGEPIPDMIAKMARAAIEAMREPTEAMMDAGIKALREADRPVEYDTEGVITNLDELERGGIDLAVGAMIDAALTEG